MDKTKHKVQELQEQVKKYHGALKRIKNMLDSDMLGIHRGKEKLYEILDEVGVYCIRGI